MTSPSTWASAIISANDAVIWIQRSKYQGRIFASMLIFLWRDAKVVEPGGTITRGDVLLATLNTFGNVGVNYRALATRSAEDTALYGRAARVRETYLQGEGQLPPAEQGTALSVLRTREPGAIRMRAPRRRVIYRADNLEPPRSSRTSASPPLPAMSTSPRVRPALAISWRSVPTRPSSGNVAGPWRSPSAAPLMPVPASRPATAPRRYRPGIARRRSAGPLGTRGEVSAVYLEGDVVLTLGERMIRARRLYYDFDNDQAYILDAVVRVNEPTRGVPFYVRADEVRQLARDRYEATNAKITTDEFYTPHYHIGAEKVVVVDRTPAMPAARSSASRPAPTPPRMSPSTSAASPCCGGPTPPATSAAANWPCGPTRFGYSDEFGITSKSRWNLFTAMGLADPEGFDADFRLDYFSERGPGVGVDMDYKRDTYNGLLRSYFIHDQGTDTFGKLLEDLEPPAGDPRPLHLAPPPVPAGRLAGHAWSSATCPMPTSCRSTSANEYYTGKEQENLIYVKKQRDNWAFTGLYKNRLNNFQTQSESLPDFSFYLLGEPLAGQQHHDLHRRPRRADALPARRSTAVQLAPLHRQHRHDPRDHSHGPARGGRTCPVDLGPVRLVPFGVIRGTWWDQTEVDPDEGGLVRGFFNYGVRSSAYAWKVFEDVQSRVLDLYRLRHVAKSETTFWFADANEGSRELTPFTHGVEDIDPFDGFTYKLRNLWQTQRGGPGRWRSVDWLTFDLTFGFFGDTPTNRLITGGDVLQFRPENSIARNFVQPKITYRLSDSTILAYDANYDFDNERPRHPEPHPGGGTQTRG